MTSQNNFSTLSELILYQANKINNPKLLNFKKNEKWISFSNQEFLEKSFYFACGLKEFGLKKNQTFAIYSYQNPLWLIADFGAILAGAITVPIFHNISQENLIYQIEDADIKYIFIDNQADFVQKNHFNKIEVITKIALEKNIKIITQDSIDFFTEQESKNEANKGMATTFEKIISLGKKAASEKKYNIIDFVKQINPQDLATIIYTSGSTGKPKGVELSHQNLVSQIKDTAIFFPLNRTDRALSALPLAHIFERMVMMFYITQNIEIYFVDDLKNIGNYLKEVEPNLITVVPRILEKVFAKIKDATEKKNFLQNKLAQTALNRALTKDVASKKNIFDKIFDLLIYKKFRQALGKNIKMIICGGAALSNEMEKFYKNIGINLFCGYGLTEASPVLAANYPNNYKFATIGKKFPSIELKIAPDQELLARGPNIMMRYHNQIQKTKETIIDGWLHTGDLATIDAEGFVKIIGRKKELFKTANGKYVSPVPIEQKITQELDFLIGAIIIAENRNFVCALLFPDFETLSRLKRKIDFVGSDTEVIHSQKLNDYVKNAINSINKELNHGEQIQKFAIIDQQISIENGEITPSMKLKRNILEEKFKDVIDNFYSASPPQTQD